jgi:hypothetical protein
MILGRDPMDPTAVQLICKLHEMEIASKFEFWIDQLDPPSVDLIIPEPPPA